MKNIILSILALASVIASNAQLVAKNACALFTVDVIDGKVNGLKPNARWQEIKDKLPCFTAARAEGDTAHCGASVFYKDRDVYFYTDRDYIEVRDKFQGKFTVPIMGAARNSLFSTLGNPKIKDDTWDAFEMSYGTLVLHYNKAGKVYLVQFANRGPDLLSLCDQSPN